MYNLHGKNFYTTRSLKIQVRQHVIDNIFRGKKRKENDKIAPTIVMFQQYKAIGGKIKDIL